MNNTSIDRMLLAILVVWTGGGLGLAAWAQAQPPAAATPPGEQFLRDKGLNPEPFTAESIGLKINLPLGVHVTPGEKVDGKLTLMVSDRPEAPTWSMRIQEMGTGDENSTAAGEVEELLEQYRANLQAHKVIANQAVTYAGRDGHLCYVERSSEQGQAYITGWLVLRTGPDVFMVFAMQTLPDHLPRLRQALEASFATIELRDLEEIASERVSRLEAGSAFIESLTPQRLRELVGQSQWHRIYRPAGAGAAAGGAEQEIGYSLVEVLEAKRGAINEGRAEANYSASEQQTGLMVRVRARIVVDAQRKDFYDSFASYWMAWDQSEEAWSVNGTRRQGDAEKSESESGIREPRATGSPRPRLTVIKRTDNTDPVPYEWEVPEHYLSQALGWVAGRLMPREADQSRTYAYYAFASSNLAPKLYQRLDEWGRAPDGSDRWILTTRFTADSPPFTSIYDSSGKLVQRTHADGSVTEPITLEALTKLWTAKGLHVERSRKR